MAITEALYFSTPIFAGRLEQASALNDALLASIYAERSNDPAGTQRSNYRALDGWHSRVTLHKEPGFAHLVGAIEDQLRAVSEASGYDPAYRLTVTSMWAIINGPGATNQAHIHPKCLWSGVYYVQTPAGCGDIEFTDPRTMALMDPPAFIPNATKKRSRWTKVTYTPEPGKMVVFPSWLYHAVAPNLTESTGDAADRVIVSFNVVQSKR